MLLLGAELRNSVPEKKNPDKIVRNENSKKIPKRNIQLDFAFSFQKVAVNPIPAIAPEPPPWRYDH